MVLRRRPEDEAISLFAGFLANPDVPLSLWAKWGSPSIPLGRGDLHITHPELCE
jgi:hypothetical protein